jgi:hypothetical protein
MHAHLAMAGRFITSPLRQHNMHARTIPPSHGLNLCFFWVLISLQHVVQFRKAAVLISCLCVLFVDYAHKTSNYIK